MITEAFIVYFKQLLGESKYVLQFDDEVMKEGSTLDCDLQQQLMIEFDAKDAKKALWDIADEKAPGADGFTGAFLCAVGVLLAMISRRLL